MINRALLLALAIVAPVGASPTPPHAALGTTASIAPADTSTKTFDVNGLRVILRRNTANDVVAANLYLLGGTRQVSPATQGIEAFLLAASERGTAKYPRELVRQKTARLGSSIVIGATEDWTLFGMTSIASTFDSTWAIFADRLMAPTLDSVEVELVRARLIAAARDQDAEPESRVGRIADSLTFIGHPYSFSAEGNPATLYSINPTALRNYLATQMTTSRMVLVVVGNIDQARVEPLVKQTLGKLNRGSYAWTPPPSAPKLGRAVVKVNAQLPTNYLLGHFAGPNARHPDYPALRVAAAVLSGRFFTEIRSRRNLSYEVSAPFIDRAIATGGIYATTVDPNATLRLMRTELTRLQAELIDRAGLERLIQQFITDFFLKNETNADQATFLARAMIYEGDYRQADRFVENLRRVTPEDVRRVARQYMRDFRFAYLGNPDKLDAAILDQF
jgi:zinc protease